jgi:quercetin dioxygenase-like cupin family protein
MPRFYFLVFLIIAFIVGFLFNQIIGFPQKAHADEKLLIDYTMENCLSELDLGQVQKSSRGWVHWFAPREITQGLNLKMSEVIAQQAKHGSHSHQSEEIFYILKGKAEFTLKDKTKIVGANSALYCPPGVEHGIRNAGDEPMRYLVIRVDK